MAGKVGGAQLLVEWVVEVGGGTGHTGVGSEPEL